MSHRDDSDTYIPVVSKCLNGGGMRRIDGESESFIVHSLRADGFDAGEDGPGRGTPLVPVAFDWQSGGDVRLNISTEHTSPLQRCQIPAVNTTLAVRRLTPRECERLQGFPDDYTQVPHHGKPAADGPRYKALGNSMAVPAMRWIMERILEAEHGL